MKIIAFGASYSQTSINRRFAGYAASCFKEAQVELLNLNDYQLPVFTVDLEKELGHPQAAKNFAAKLEEADLLIISMAEHNGSYTAAFKNLFDWTSRFKHAMFEGKVMLLLSTSDGARGGASVIEAAKTRFPRHGANILATFSLPGFNKNFTDNEGIVNPELKTEFDKLIKAVEEAYVKHIANN